MACRQMGDPRKQPLIGALRRIGRGLLDEVALHPVDMSMRRDPVIAAEQARQARVADRDVEVVRIIVGNVFQFSGRGRSVTRPIARRSSNR